MHASATTESPPESRTDPAAGMRWRRATWGALHDRGLAFIDQHPSDPKRWDVLVLIGPLGEYVKPVQSPYGHWTYVPDPDRAGPWSEAYFARLEHLTAAPDASPSARLEALAQLIFEYRQRSLQVSASTAGDNARKMLRWFAQARREFPHSGKIQFLAIAVAAVLEEINRNEATEFLRQVADSYDGSSDPYDISTYHRLEGRLRLLRGYTMPVDNLRADLARADARFAEESAVHGKVVLIVQAPVSYRDTMAQLETVYRNYHGAGLEIVQLLGRQPDGGGIDASRWPWAFIVQTTPPFFMDRWGLTTAPAWLVVGRNGRIVAHSGGTKSMVTAIEERFSPRAN